MNTRIILIYSRLRMLLALLMIPFASYKMNYNLTRGSAKNETMVEKERSRLFENVNHNMFHVQAGLGVKI